jgi:hypothetical protein
MRDLVKDEPVSDHENIQIAYGFAQQNINGRDEDTHNPHAQASS